MIEHPYDLIADDLSVISAFDSSGRPVTFWGDPQVGPVRSRIKHYYYSVQHMRCCYCNQQILVDHMRAWDLEHVSSQARYPDFMFEPLNLALACIDCNVAKRDEEVFSAPPPTGGYPLESSAFLICHPHYDELSNHIAIFGGVLFVPLDNSPKGKFTISACNLWRYATKLIGLDLNPEDPSLLDAIQRLQKGKTDAERRYAMLEVCLRVQGAFFH